MKSSSCTFYFLRLYHFRYLLVHTASLIFPMWKALPSPCRVIARDEQGQQQALPPSAGAKIRNTVTLWNAEDLSHITGAAATEQSDGKGSAAKYAASFKSETAASFFLLVSRSVGRRQRSRRSTRSRCDTGGRTWFPVAGVGCQSVGCDSLLPDTYRFKRD